MLQLLSHNFHVLSSSILRPSADILCQDGNLLAAEVILALHYTRSDNSDVLNSLLEQAMSWVDSSSGIPLLVPLASWVKPKTCPLVVSCRFQEPWSVDGTAGALVLEPTLNHQHVLVSGGGHGFAIWMYHISSRKQVRSFEGHQSSVVFLKTIADGQLFLSCACDGMVMIWSWTQVNCHRSFRPGKGKLLSACVAHSNEFLLTGFADCQVVLTPLFSEGNELANEARTFAHHTGPVTALALTSQDMYLLSGSADFTVVISCMRTGLPISTLSGLMAPVKTLAVTSNDAFAVLSCEDESLKVFSICMSSQLLEIIGHEEKICSLAIATDDCRVFAGSSDGKVYCFDLHTGELVSTQTCHQKAVSCLKLSADGLLLMSGSVDGFNVWSTYTNDADNGNEANYVCVATISPDYKYAAYGNNSGRVILWDLENCHDIWMTPSANDPLVTSLQFDHDSVILLSGSADGLVRILSMANGLTLKTYEGHSHPVTCLRIFTDRSVVISLDSLGHVILWSTEDTEDCSYEAFGLSDVGSLLEFLDDSDVLVTVKDNEKELKVLNMVGREEAWVTKARLQHNDDITCLCVSANGQVLVTGSKDMSLKLWSIKSASLTQVMAEHQQPVKHCAVNVDGSMVVSASTSEALSWNVCSGQSLCSFEAHKAPITSLVVSEDGKIALSSDENGWLYAWHTVDGDRIACFNAHLPVVSILISPDCRRIVLTLERCPHIACLCLHNIPFYEDIVSDSFSAQTFGVPSSIISGRAVIDSNINDIANVPNTNSIQTVKVQPLSSVNNASRDAPARRSRPGTASSNFKRSRSSLRLFDKLKRNQTQFFNVSPSVRSSYRGELIPTAMLASQSVCGAVTMSHSSGNKWWLSLVILDVGVLACFFWLLAIAVRYQSNCGRAQCADDSNIRYAFLGWLAYSLVLSVKICIIFKMVIQHLKTSDLFGPGTLELTLSASALIFLLLVLSHHFNNPRSPRQLFLSYLASTVTLDVIDSIVFLKLLIDPVRRQLMADHPGLDTGILFLACFNFVLPTFCLFKLRYNFGLPTWVPLPYEQFYSLMYFITVNLPFLLIRIFVVSDPDSPITGGSVFMIKNVIMLVIGVREAWVAYIRSRQGEI
uniref:WD_REPEATS_REGION domain-containing protein n=1 Tax=Trichuris muris TaxID=70415 RepID=A0A5S6QXY6_TRIMR